jgi:hypothetical protein
MLLLCLESGCSEYAGRSDFEQCKARITSIAIVPPIVYYTSYQNPLFTYKGWEVGGTDDRYDPYLTDATQKNIEAVAKEIIGGSKYKRVDCAWPSDLDVRCAPNLERLRKAVPGTLDEIDHRHGKDLNISMGTDCSTVGECAGASHLLFIEADGWSTRKMFDHYTSESIWGTILGGERTNPDTGEAEPCKLRIRVLLIEASSGAVVFASNRAQMNVPGSHVKGTRAMLKKVLKPVL